MEQSIGKRIAVHRKRLGLTQDQLAERLGVTAQAVSKWENDQSCPDITTIPRLAEIFGITTDELLGHTPPPPVHTAAPVQEEDESEGVHINRGNFEMTWRSGRRTGLFFAGFVLLVGVLMLVSALLQWDVGFWSICWPSFMLVMGIYTFTKRFSFFGLGCALFGLYFLVDNLGIWHLDVGGAIIFPAIIVIFGLSLLVDALRKPKKPRFQVRHNGSGGKKTVNEYNTDGEHAECSLSFGEAHRVISLPRLSSGDFGCSFGELTVDLCGCEEISDGCHIDADCSFGEMEILVPRKYRVELDQSSAFGSVDIQGSPNAAAEAIICLDANASFGQITVRYI